MKRSPPVSKKAKQKSKKEKKQSTPKDGGHSSVKKRHNPSLRKSSLRQPPKSGYIVLPTYVSSESMKSKSSELMKLDVVSSGITIVEQKFPRQDGRSKVDKEKTLSGEYFCMPSSTDSVNDGSTKERENPSTTSQVNVPKSRHDASSVKSRLDNYKCWLDPLFDRPELIILDPVFLTLKGGDKSVTYGPYEKENLIKCINNKIPFRARTYKRAIFQALLTVDSVSNYKISPVANYYDGLLDALRSKENVFSEEMKNNMANNFIEAVYSKDSARFRLFLTEGLIAPVDPTTFYTTEGRDKHYPLHRAVECRNISVARFLIQLVPYSKREHFITQSAPENLSTPILIATASGYTELVELLLDNRSDSNLRAKNGFSPLSLALYNGYSKVVGVLLERKVKRAAFFWPHGRGLQERCLQGLVSNSQLVRKVNKALNINLPYAPLHARLLSALRQHDLIAVKKLGLGLGTMDFDFSLAGRDTVFHLLCKPTVPFSKNAVSIAKLMLDGFGKKPGYSAKLIDIINRTNANHDTVLTFLCKAYNKANIENETPILDLIVFFVKNGASTKSLLGEIWPFKYVSDTGNSKKIRKSLDRVLRKGKKSLLKSAQSATTRPKRASSAYYAKKKIAQSFSKRSSVKVNALQPRPKTMELATPLIDQQKSPNGSDSASYGYVPLPQALGKQDLRSDSFTTEQAGPVTSEEVVMQTNATGVLDGSKMESAQQQLKTSPNQTDEDMLSHINRVPLVQEDVIAELLRSSGVHSGIQLLPDLVDSHEVYPQSDQMEDPIQKLQELAFSKNLQNTDDQNKSPMTISSRTSLSILSGSFPPVKEQVSAGLLMKNSPSMPTVSQQDDSHLNPADPVEHQISFFNNGADKPTPIPTSSQLVGTDSESLSVSKGNEPKQNQSSQSSPQKKESVSSFSQTLNSIRELIEAVLLQCQSNIVLKSMLNAMPALIKAANDKFMDKEYKESLENIQNIGVLISAVKVQPKVGIVILSLLNPIESLLNDAVGVVEEHSKQSVSIKL